MSALGDVLNTLPALAVLRARLPDARIDWAVEDRAAMLLQGREDLDRVHVLPRQALGRKGAGLLRPRTGLLRVARFVMALRAERYDVTIDLQGNLKSGVVTRLSRADLRLGFDRRVTKEANHLFTTRRWLPDPAEKSRIGRHVGLISALFGESLSWRAPGFAVTPAAEAESERALAEAGLPASGFVCFHPGTSGFGAFKRWPVDRYAALARRLARPIAVTFGPEERELAQAVADDSDGHARLVPTRSLESLAAVIARARLFVAGDTGPLHLAALLETPLLGLFGPKDPEIYGPFGRDEDGTIGPLPVLVQEDVACRPCTLRRCENPLCMRTLAVDRVHETIRARLG